MSDINQLARGGADSGMNIARQNGVTLPKELLAAETMLRTIEAIIKEAPEPAKTLPADPVKIRAALAEQATATALLASIKAGADAALGPVVATYVNTFRGTVPAITSAVCAKFADAWATFTESAQVAPVNLGGYASETQVAAFMAVSRSVDQLDVLIAHRAELGLSVGEAGITNGQLFVLADVPPVESDPARFEDAWRTVDDFMKSWSSLAPGVHRWRALAASGFPVALVEHNCLDERQEHLERWHGANGALHSAGGSAAFTQGMAQGGFAFIKATQEQQMRARTDKVRADATERLNKAAVAREEAERRGYEALMARR